MWQLIKDHVTVTRNLSRRNMRCDNYCPRCGEPKETVTDAIFECHKLCKYGPSQQHNLHPTSSRYRVSTPIWTIFSGGRIVSPNKN